MSENKAKRLTTSIRINVDTYDKVRVLAEHEKRSMSMQIEVLVDEALQARAEQEYLPGD